MPRYLRTRIWDRPVIHCTGEASNIAPKVIIPGFSAVASARLIMASIEITPRSAAPIAPTMMSGAMVASVRTISWSGVNRFQSGRLNHVGCTPKPGGEDVDRAFAELISSMPELAAMASSHTDAAFEDVTISIPSRAVISEHTAWADMRRGRRGCDGEYERRYRVGASARRCWSQCCRGPAEVSGVLEGAVSCENWRDGHIIYRHRLTLWRLRGVWGQDCFMSGDGFQLTGGAAELYEDQKVPGFFGPLADATLDLHPVAPHDLVLDVACGTGVVSRRILSRMSQGPTITGIDLDEGMIKVARRVCERDALAIDFQVCDAAATPFADAAFTLVICQQGLQFFPDEDLAFNEFRRVTQPGGRLVFTIWSRPNPFAVALLESLRRHVSEDAGARALVPFSWAGAETVASRLSAAGYADIDHQELEFDRVVTAALPEEIMGTTAGPALAEKGEAVFDAAVEEIRDATAMYRSGNDLSIPSYAHVVSAVAT